MRKDRRIVDRLLGGRRAPNISRLLEEISGHVDRDHASRKGAHATAEQHREWRAANPESIRAANERYRDKHRFLDRLRARVLAIILRRDPDLAKEAMAEALEDEQ